MANVTVNMTKKDIFNARSASKLVKDVIGEVLTVSGCTVRENEGINKLGEACDVGYICTDRGVFGFTSAVMLKSMRDFAEYLEECLNDGEEVQIRFFTGKSNSGSEFYNFEIV